VEKSKTKKGTKADFTVMNSCPWCGRCMPLVPGPTGNKQQEGRTRGQGGSSGEGVGKAREMGCGLSEETWVAKCAWFHSCKEAS